MKDKNKKQSIDDFGPCLKKILSKMCQVVGADPSDIDFKTDNWYSTYSWSQTVESGFKKWMVNYIRTTTAARKELFGFGYYVKKDAVEREVDMFVLNYGWRTARYRDTE